MDTPTVSNTSEGIYIGLDSPDQDVYSTVGQTSHNSPGAQHTETSGQSSHPYRLAGAVCVVLCALLLTPAIVFYSGRRESQMITGLKTVQLLRGGGGGGLMDGLMYTAMCIIGVSTRMCTAQWARPHTTAQELSTQRQVDKAHIPTDWLYCPLRSQKRVCRPCPEGWEQRNSTCYYFSTGRKSWDDSRSACLKQGADLMIIESKEEQDFIYNHTGTSVYWIGLSDSETEGIWLWVDGTPLQKDKAFWATGEPNDHRSEDCAATGRVRGGGGGWADERCHRLLRSVCETDALPL
ncbi:hypothetical protein AAFF_G00420490 [Aldrovandia affinis]|uniref:C-type lectin domain-containing protein n=1 Tax=Aldrovandia affinis TaxID=143900 RepID=A0AAD7R3D0_9TELE|nr:hypothetical protein AAFF_G00420490 [Aldrovandia affinis]